MVKLYPVLLPGPGEVLLLPAYWQHATLNLGTSVAVGSQANSLRWRDALHGEVALRTALGSGQAQNPRLLGARLRNMTKRGEIMYVILKYTRKERVREERV